MRLAPQRRRDGLAEPLLPLIDVVFFLIIFFMMVSRLAEPDPVEVVRPQAAAPDEVAGELSLYLGRDGVVVARAEAGPVRGEAAVAALVARCGTGCGTVLIHADQAAPAKAVAGLLADLARAGLADVRLVTVAG